MYDTFCPTCQSETSKCPMCKEYIPKWLLYCNSGTCNNCGAERYANGLYGKDKYSKMLDKYTRMTKKEEFLSEEDK